MNTSVLKSAILHHQTDYNCQNISDCPYIGKTLLEKRELLDTICELSDKDKDLLLDEKDEPLEPVTLSFCLPVGYNVKQNKNRLDEKGPSSTNGKEFSLDDGEEG